MQRAFYGVGAAVIAIIGRAAWKLARGTVGEHRLFWVIYAVSALITAWTETEFLSVFLVAGVVSLVVVGGWRPGRLSVAVVPWPLLWTGLHGEAPAGALTTIALFFGKAGAFVFGSGLAIVPFLYSGVVKEHGWLTEQQFLDAVAVAMITPGPVVITVGFIGYLVAGPLGATVAADATFFPCWVFTVVPAPHFRRWGANPLLKAFVGGVTAAASGAIAGAAVVLARRSLVDLPTVLIALVVLGLLVWWKRASEPVLILVAAAVGLLVGAR
jgi:chromate transporter